MNWINVIVGAIEFWSDIWKTLPIIQYLGPFNWPGLNLFSLGFDLFHIWGR